MLTGTNYMMSIASTIRAAAIQSIRQGKPVVVRGFDHEAVIDVLVTYADETHAYAQGKHGSELRALGTLHGRAFGLIFR